MHIVNRKSILITALVSVVVFILALNTSSFIYKLMIPKIQDIRYSIDPQEITSKTLLLAIIIGLVPSFCLVIWTYAHIESVKRRLISIVLIVACMSISILAKRTIIRKEAKLVLFYRSLDSRMEPLVNLNAENFTPYILSGILAGGLISIFLLRKNAGIKTAEINAGHF